MQIVSGILLFFYKIGYSFETVSDYYLGNEDTFVMPKSFHGLLETSMPHLVAQVGISFIVAHFLMFINEISTKKLLWGYSLVLFAILDILSPYFILWFGDIFIWLKLIAFIGFEISLFVVLSMVLFSYISSFHNN